MATGHLVLQTGAGECNLCHSYKILFNRLCCSNLYHLNLSCLATPGCATPKQQYLKSSVWARSLHKLFPIAHLGMSQVGARKHSLLVYNQPFCSQRIQDPKGHLCFLNALLHHEVTINILKKITFIKTLLY